MVAQEIVDVPAMPSYAHGEIIIALGAALYPYVGPIKAGVGGVTIDLASAPLLPGEYRLQVNRGVGGIEIYLPRYVQFVLDGTSVVGGKNVHEGLGAWKTLENRLRALVHLPSQIPDHAVAPADPERPVRITLVINTGVGGVDIYRL